MAALSTSDLLDALMRVAIAGLLADVDAAAVSTVPYGVGFVLIELGVVTLACMSRESTVTLQGRRASKG